MGAIPQLVQAEAACRVCGGVVVQRGAGRPRRYCSPECKAEQDRRSKRERGNRYREKHIPVTQGNQLAADALISVWLDRGGDHSLSRFSHTTGIPLSDLFGAVRRRFHDAEPTPEEIGRLSREARRRRRAERAVQNGR